MIDRVRAGTGWAALLATAWVSAWPAAADEHETRTVAVLEQALDAARTEAAGRVSAEGAKLLAENDRRWARHVKRVCGERVVRDADRKRRVIGPREADQCLRDQYAARLEAVRKLPIRAGALRFLPEERYDEWLIGGGADAGFGQFPGYGYARVAVPWLDAPDAWRSGPWHRLQREAPARLFPGLRRREEDDLLVGFEVIAASERFITIRYWHSDYGHGAAHDQNGVAMVSTRGFTAREVGPKELFLPGPAWGDLLEAALLEALRDAFRGTTWQADQFERAAVRKVARAPDRWDPGPAGLGVTFAEMEVASRAEGAIHVTVPWGRLASVLLPDARRTFGWESGAGASKAPGSP